MRENVKYFNKLAEFIDANTIKVKLFSKYS
jgi:hypothetical protein